MDFIIGHLQKKLGHIISLHRYPYICIPSRTWFIYCNEQKTYRLRKEHKLGTVNLWTYFDLCSVSRNEDHVQHSLSNHNSDNSFSVSLSFTCGHPIRSKNLVPGQSTSSPSVVSKSSSKLHMYCSLPSQPLCSKSTGGRVCQPQKFVENESLFHEPLV